MFNPLPVLCLSQVRNLQSLLVLCVFILYCCSVMILSSVWRPFHWISVKRSQLKPVVFSRCLVDWGSSFQYSLAVIRNIWRTRFSTDNRHLWEQNVDLFMYSYDADSKQARSEEWKEASFIIWIPLWKICFTDEDRYVLFVLTTIPSCFFFWPLTYRLDLSSGSYLHESKTSATCRAGSSYPSGTSLVFD